MKSIICLLSLCFFVLITSCGSEDEVSPADQLIGTWTGGLNQQDFGVLETTLNIRSLEVSSTSGNGTFSTIDVSNCDDTQFICEPLMCNFNLTLLSSAGSTFEIDQMLIGSSTCGDGIFEITVVNDNALDVVWYQEAFPDNRASGRLRK